MPPSTVLAWTIPLRQPADRLAELPRYLDDSERHRHARLSAATGGDAYLVAHAYARLILARHLGVAPGRVRWHRNQHGKPRLVGIPAAPHVSLSHSGELALIAVADRPVGVDVECVQQRWRLRPPVGLFPASEIAAVAEAGPLARAELFVRLLTRKEACVKAAGSTMLAWGLRLPTMGDEPLVVRDARSCWRIRELPVPAGYGASVALAGAGEFDVVTRCWR